jgi:hypothetical protein
MSKEVDVDTNSLPGGAKIGAAAAGGLGVMALVYRFRNEAAFLAILLIGIVFVIMLLLGYKYLIEVREKKKGKAFGGGLGQGAGARPAQVTASEQRVLLDDLRKKFQDGLKVFEASGKSVYRLPWYLVVGEPGSGKSRMIERSGVPGPTRLKDPVEGAGGTINMNWWFRNEAVMLDTAGRLMMPEVATAESPEWDNFLQLLNNYRPHCPVNGLFLVIPADTLVTDTAEKLDGKARQIAQQFDRIQTALGIRFPVYVVITKCDKINGFRHFFEGMNQPEEQAQMIGWSNPAPLDEPFQPELVEKHLTGVRERLVKRRLKLLEDPINRVDPSGRRLDEVDSLYLFPDNLASLGTRLRRYLEAIFVAGEWSSMPLFLRGIYFTSALQKGGVVDKALSDALGVDVAAALGEDKQSETPYFLRDLFMEKSFKEKGLVTRASNVDQLKRRRKVVLLATGFVAAVALGAFTWLGQRQLETAVGDQARFWDAVQRKSDARVVRGGKYLGGEAIADRLTFKDVHEQGPRSLASPITIPAVYRPMSFVSGDPNQVRPEAYRALFQNTVLAPLVDATRDRMKYVDAAAWDDRATAALRQLFWLESGQNLDPARATGGAPLRPMFAFVLQAPDDLKAYQADQKVYEDAFAAVYKNGEVPRTAALGVGTPDAQEAIVRGVEAFVKHWEGESNGSSKKALALQAVAAALVDFQKAEDRLLNLSGRGAQTTSSGADAYLDRWNEANAGLTRAKRTLDDALASDALHWDHKALLSEEYRTSVEQVQTTRRNAILDLLAALPPTSGGAADKSEALAKARQRLEEARAKADATAEAAKKDSTQKQLADLEGGLLAQATGLENKAQHKYEIHYDVLQRATAPLNPPAAGEKFAAAAAEVTRSGKATRDAIESLAGKPEFSRDSNFKSVCDVAIDMAKLAEARARTTLVKGELRRLPKDAAGWGEAVAARVSQQPAQLMVPFTDPQARFDPKYDPAAAKSAVETVRAIGEQLNAPPQGGGPRVLDADDLRAGADAAEVVWRQYLGQYRNYWQSDLPGQVTKIAPDHWAALAQRLRGTKLADIDGSLRQVAEQRAGAFEAIGDDAAAKRAREALETLNSLKFAGEARERLSNWAQVPEGVDAARERLLRLTWVQLRDGYLMEPAAASPNFVEAYWQNLCRAGLGTIAGDVQKAADAAVAQLRQLKRFPLAPFKPGDGNGLSPAQVDKAATLIKAVRARQDKPNDSIARADFPNWLGDLAGTVTTLRRGASELSDEDQTWLTQVQGFLEAREDKALTWAVRMRPSPQQVAGMLQQQAGIYYVRLDAGADGTWAWGGQTEESKITPGGELLSPPNAPVFGPKPFDVILTGALNTDKTQTKPLAGEPNQGDWAVAKFMGSLEKLEKTGPKQWTGQLPLSRLKNQELSVPVTVTFSREIDWPSLAPAK